MSDDRKGGSGKNIGSLITRRKQKQINAGKNVKIRKKKAHWWQTGRMTNGKPSREVFPWMPDYFA